MAYKFKCTKYEIRSKTGADLEGGAPGARPPCSRLDVRQKNAPPRFSLIIYTVAPPGSIFSGSAPEKQYQLDASIYIL